MMGRFYRIFEWFCCTKFRTGLTQLNKTYFDVLSIWEYFLDVSYVLQDGERWLSCYFLKFSIFFH